MFAWLRCVSCPSAFISLKKIIKLKKTTGQKVKKNPLFQKLKKMISKIQRFTLLRGQFAIRRRGLLGNQNESNQMADNSGAGGVHDAIDLHADPRGDELANEDIHPERIVWPTQRVCGNCLAKSSSAMHSQVQQCASGVLVQNLANHFMEHTALKRNMKDANTIRFSWSTCKLITGATSYCRICKSCTGLVRKADANANCRTDEEFVYQVNRANAICQSLKIMQCQNEPSAVKKIRKARKSFNTFPTTHNRVRKGSKSTKHHTDKI